MTRDVLLLVLPGIAFVIEIFKPHPSVELLVAYMAFLSAPGLAAQIWRARHGIEPPSEPSAQPLPSPPSSSSSSSGM